MPIDSLEGRGRCPPRHPARSASAHERAAPPRDRPSRREGHREPRRAERDPSARLSHPRRGGRGAPRRAARKLRVAYLSRARRSVGSASPTEPRRPPRTVPRGRGGRAQRRIPAGDLALPGSGAHRPSASSASRGSTSGRTGSSGSSSSRRYIAFGRKREKRGRRSGVRQGGEAGQEPAGATGLPCPRQDA